MTNAPLKDRLLELYDGMPTQLQAAAHWMLEHAGDVPLLSMREQAKRAGVPPTTMTRLAQRLGFDGYETVRTLYADAFRRNLADFAERAGELVERRRAQGEDALSVDMVQTTAAQVDLLRAPETLAALGKAARMIVEARRIFVLGLRASYPVAYQLAYECSLVGCEPRLLDGPGGLGLDPLNDAGPEDLCLAISVRPYTRITVDIAAYAERRGTKIVAITDSPVSPLAKIAMVTVFVGVESPSFFHTMTPAFAAAETLAALVAARSGDRSRAALSKRELQFEALDTFILPRAGTRSYPTKADH